MNTRVPLNLAATLLAAASLLALPCPAVDPASSVSQPETSPAPVEIPAGFSRLMTDLVREYLPHEYEDTKHWGGQERIQTGLKVFFDKGHLTSRRTFREVNHGTWHRARFELIDPEHDFDVRVAAIRQSAEGQPEMDLVVTARVRCFARMSRWQWGVQLVSLSSESTARVELRMTCQLALKLDLSRLPPDVLLRPKIESAQIRVTEFEVDKVSKVGGEVAEQLGRLAEGLLKRKLEEQGERLPAKLNAKIEKNPDRWRLSLADMAASGWAGWLGEKEKKDD